MSKNYITKSIEKLIIENIVDISPFEYRLYCSKHTSPNSIYNKFEQLEKWVKSRECDIIIVKEERIIVDKRAIDFKINGFASNIINEILVSNNKNKYIL